jgi:hypothetical protein
MADDPVDEFILDFLARRPPEQLRVAADITKRAENNAAQERRWVQELVIAVEAFVRLGPRAPWPMFHMLWLRLSGVFRELLDQHRVLYEISKLEPGRRSYADYGAAIYLACDATLNALTDEEHVAADFFRQRAAHVRQDAYTVRFGKAREVRDQRTLDHIEKTFTIEEVDAILLSLLRQFGNEVEIAVHVAKKVEAHVAELSKAMEALHQLPPVKVEK